MTSTTSDPADALEGNWWEDEADHELIAAVTTRVEAVRARVAKLLIEETQEEAPEDPTDPSTDAYWNTPEQTSARAARIAEVRRCFNGPEGRPDRVPKVA